MDKVEFKEKLLGYFENMGMNVWKRGLLERYTIDNNGVTRVVDINKQYGKYKDGVTFEVLVADILDKLEPEKDKGKERDRDWILRNVTLGVMQWHNVTSDVVYRKVEGTGLVLVVSTLHTAVDDLISTSRTRITESLLNYYNINEDSIFEAAKKNVLNSSIELGLRADGGVQVEDSVAVFLPEFMNREFGKETWYITAYTYDDIRVYPSREQCAEKSIFITNNMLCDNVIKYNNGKYEQED